MKKQLIFYLILVTNLNCGCRPVIKLIYGAKAPRYETKQSLEKFHEVVFKDDHQNFAVSFDAWKNNKLFSMPEVFVFDIKGRYLPYKDSLKPNCNGPAEVFLAELDISRNYHFDSTKTLRSFVSSLETIDCEPATINLDAETDFYIFMTWAKFTGKKIYRQKTCQWLKALNENKKIRFNVFYVNQDLQQCWTEEQKNYFISDKKSE